MTKRDRVYVMRPKKYEIAGCECGNTDPDWSEWQGHLWCYFCQKDFIPSHGGVFDGPIPVNASNLLGMDYRQIILATGEIVDPLAPEPESEGDGLRRTGEGRVDQ